MTMDEVHIAMQVLGTLVVPITPEEYKLREVAVKTLTNFLNQEEE